MPTFLHAADLHLDSPLRGLETKGATAAVAERIRGATRTAFVRLVDEAVRRKVAFVVLAGDLYDTKPAYDAFREFHRGMRQLSDAGIPVAIVLGNHDHAGVSPRAERLPSGVRVLSASAPESWSIVPGVVVHGRSFPVREVLDDLSADYPAAVPGRLNVGLLHTALEGHADHAKYAPTSLQALAGKGYQYWALGHVHTHEVRDERGTRVVFPGNLQGRSVRETGPRGAVVVEYEGARVSRVERLFVDDVRWHDVRVDAASLPAEGDAYAAVAALVRAAVAEDLRAGRLPAVRVTVAGEGAGEAGRLTATELRESLPVALGEEVFLEKVSVDVRPSQVDRSEAERQLVALADELAGSPSGRASLAKLVELGREELRKGDAALAEQTPLLGRRHDPMSEERARALLGEAMALIRESLAAGGGGR